MNELAKWRKNVIDVCVHDFPRLGGKVVAGYAWPELSVHTPAVVLSPGINGTYLDADSEFCSAGVPQARLLWLIDERWEAEAFNVLDEVAAGIGMTGARSGVFTVLRVENPGVVADSPGSLPIYIGLPVEVAGHEPILP